MWNSISKLGSGSANWFHKRVVDPLVLILKRGAEPKQLTLSAALGVTLGVFPICGVPLFLCGMAIAVLGSRCHAPTVMLSNFVATPLELRYKIAKLSKAHASLMSMAIPSSIMGWVDACTNSLVIPFLRFGEVVTGGSHFPLTSDALKKVLKGQASQEVFQSIFHALLGWLVATPIIFVTSYLLFFPCFKILVQKFRTIPSSPKTPTLSQTDIKLKVRDV